MDAEWNVLGEHRKKSMQENKKGKEEKLIQPKWFRRWIIAMIIYNSFQLHFSIRPNDYLFWLCVK